ncbi:MAG: hypothetical protein AAFY24_17055 [Pseudomonadota bacterium]
MDFDPFNKAIADECNNGISGQSNQMLQRERFRARGKVRQLHRRAPFPDSKSPKDPILSGILRLFMKSPGSPHKSPKHARPR